jgi:hypothetical protein
LYAAAFGLKVLPSSPSAGANIRSGPLRKVSNAFADTLFTPFGRVSSGVTVAVDPAEWLFMESILNMPSIYTGIRCWIALNPQNSPATLKRMVKGTVYC